MSLSLLTDMQREIAKKWPQFPLYCSTWEAISLQQNEFIAKIAHMALKENPVLDGQLHLLHVAVIFLNHDAVESFLQAGANPNQPDQYGWTPLHFAALATDRRMMEHLSRHKAGHDLKTMQGWTPQDIFAFVDRAPPKSISLIYEDAEGKRELLTPQKFEELTHARYTNSCKAEANLLNQYRKTSKAYPLSDAYDYIRNLNSLTDAPPPFVMKPIKESVGFGIFTNRKILKNTIIGEYTGYHAKEKVDGKYLLGHVNAQEWRNHTAMINDGFPNCYLFTIEGPIKRHFLISIEEIPPGKELCWNYGPTRLKMIPYIELREKELESFMKNNSIDSLIENHKTIGAMSLSDNHLARFSQVEKLHYLLQTPSALFRLGVKGVLSTEDVQRLYAYAIESKLISEEYRKTDIPNGLKEFNDFMQKWKNSCPLTTDAFGALVLKIPEVRGIDNTLNIMKAWIEKIDAQLMKSTSSFSASPFSMSPFIDAMVCRQLQTLPI